VKYTGKINVMAFDKTGTLTQDYLEFNAIICNNPTSNLFLEPQETIQGSILEDILVTCHSLSKVDNSLVGNAVDRRMFETTGWALEDTLDADFIMTVNPPSGSRQSSIGIIKRFDFDPQVARSSVVYKNSHDTFAACKGSGDSIRKICLPETIPSNFKEVMNRFSSQGLYVLACAKKKVSETDPNKCKAMKRTEVESGNFVFCGFLLLIVSFEFFILSVSHTLFCKEPNQN
jgi:cation-transporting ATPase 13A3/4/5